MRRHRSIIAVLLCIIALFSTSTHAKKNGNKNNNKRDKRGDTTRTTNGKRNAQKED